MLSKLLKNRNQNQVEQEQDHEQQLRSEHKSADHTGQRLSRHVLDSRDLDFNDQVRLLNLHPALF